MPKAPTRTSEQLKIEVFAKRRAGATYIDASTTDVYNVYEASKKVQTFPHIPFTKL